jgi:hypothetical protein
VNVHCEFDKLESEVREDDGFDEVPEPDGPELKVVLKDEGGTGSGNFSNMGLAFSPDGRSSPEKELLVFYCKRFFSFFGRVKDQVQQVYVSVSP